MNQHQKQSKRRQRLLEEVQHPVPRLRIAVAVLVAIAIVTAAVLGSCQS